MFIFLFHISLFAFVFHFFLSHLEDNYLNKRKDLLVLMGATVTLFSFLTTVYKYKQSEKKNKQKKELDQFSLCYNCIES